MALAVHHHHAVADAHLVRVQPGRDVGGPDDTRVARVRHVHDGRAVRRVHVAEIGVVALHHDLAAAGAVEPGDFVDAGTVAHVRSPVFLAATMRRIAAAGQSCKRLPAAFASTGVASPRPPVIASVNTTARGCRESSQNQSVALTYSAAAIMLHRTMRRRPSPKSGPRPAEPKDRADEPVQPSALAH